MQLLVTYSIMILYGNKVWWDWAKLPEQWQWRSSGHVYYSKNFKQHRSVVLGCKESSIWNNGMEWQFSTIVDTKKEVGGDCQMNEKPLENAKLHLFCSSLAAEAGKPRDCIIPPKLAADDIFSIKSSAIGTGRQPQVSRGSSENVHKISNLPGNPYTTLSHILLCMS